MSTLSILSLVWHRCCFDQHACTTPVLKRACIMPAYGSMMMHYRNTNKHAINQYVSLRLLGFPIGHIKVARIQIKLVASLQCLVLMRHIDGVSVLRIYLVTTHIFTYSPISLLASEVNPAMVSRVRFCDRNELYGSPDVRNCRMPNVLGWAFLLLA